MHYLWSLWTIAKPVMQYLWSLWTIAKPSSCYDCYTNFARPSLWAIITCLYHRTLQHPCTYKIYEVLQFQWFVFMKAMLQLATWMSCKISSYEVTKESCSRWVEEQHFAKVLTLLNNFHFKLEWKLRKKKRRKTKDD